jgi:hypothetical protein
MTRKYRSKNKRSTTGKNTKVLASNLQLQKKIYIPKLLYGKYRRSTN